MQALIDMDILLYEGGYAGEFVDKETGEEVLLSAEEVLEWVENKIEDICECAEASDPILYTSASERFVNEYNKKEGTNLPFVPNFRYEVAKTKPYKGNRVNKKPFHFYNIFSHLLHTANVIISEDGLEADDMMSIEQVKRGDETIICSRDKDLRICPGWHMAWECGKQPLIFPHKTDTLGSLEMWNGKVLGYGMKFFYFQMLVGDTADNIPGLPKWGEKKSFNLLEPLETEKEMFSTVKDLYKQVMGEASKEYFMEQANLLWIIQKKGEGYKLPEFQC